jgi:hypothetical protein
LYKAKPILKNNKKDDMTMTAIQYHPNPTFPSDWVAWVVLMLMMIVVLVVVGMEEVLVVVGMKDDDDGGIMVFGYTAVHISVENG